MHKYLQAILISCKGNMKGSYTITSTAHHSVDVGVPVDIHLVEDVAEVAVGDSVILPRLLDCPACLLDILNDVLQ